MCIDICFHLNRDAVFDSDIFLNYPLYAHVVRAVFEQRVLISPACKPSEKELVKAIFDLSLNLTHCLFIEISIQKLQLSFLQIIQVKRNMI